MLRDSRKHSLRQVVAFEEMAEVENRRLIGNSVTTEIETDLASSRRAGLITCEDTHVSRLVLRLDDEGRDRVNAWLRELVGRCVDEQRASDERAAQAATLRHSMLAVLNIDIPS